MVLFGITEMDDRQFYAHSLELVTESEEPCGINCNWWSCRVFVGKLDSSGTIPPSENLYSVLVANFAPASRTFLDDKQVRSAISTALRAAEVDSAISLLSGLEDGVEKREECGRVFAYCIKNCKLSKAKSVASDCWDGEMEKHAFYQIELEGLKQH